ncbi:MAG: hypothetical protein V1717_03255 [Candidatus Micrarchaeota archaeon]
MRAGKVVMFSLLACIFLLFVLNEWFLGKWIFMASSNVLLLALSGFAVYGAFRALNAAYYNDIATKFCLVFLAGAFLWFFGEVSWVAQTVFFGIELPYPSISDAFWVLGSLVFCIALLFRLNNLVSVDTRLSQVEVGIILGAALFISILVFFGGGAFSFDASSLEKTLNLIYATLDFVLFLGAISIAFVLAGEAVQYGLAGFSKTWVILAASFGLFAIYDILFGQLVVNDVYTQYGLVDGLYYVAYWLLALGGFMYEEDLRPSGL